MFITVEATYESGVLKLHQPLPFDEHETVQVTVQTDKAGPTGAAIPRHDPALTAPVATDRARAASSTADEPSDFAESEMVDIWLNVPPSPAARTVVARHAPLPLPDPPVIPPDDDEIG